MRGRDLIESRGAARHRRCSAAAWDSFYESESGELGLLSVKKSIDLPSDVSN